MVLTLLACRRRSHGVRAFAYGRLTRSRSDGPRKSACPAEHREWGFSCAGRPRSMTPAVMWWPQMGAVACCHES